MPRFIGNVVVEQDANWWMLWAAIWYEDDGRDPPLMIRVPKGFITDFASTPKALWNVLPPSDYRYTAAAIVHDRLYETHELSRAEADAVFFDAMAVQSTPNWKRWLMWAAVRLFGRAAYVSGPMRQAERLAVESFRKVPRNVTSLRGRNRKNKEN